MCHQSKCIDCGIPAKSCSLTNGKCYACKNKKPTLTIPESSPVTPPNNYIDVYHTL